MEFFAPDFVAGLAYFAPGELSPGAGEVLFPRTVALTIMALDQRSQPMAGAAINVALDRVDIDPDHGYILPDPVQAEADQNGRLVLQVWPNSLGKLGSKYVIKITDMDTAKITRLSALVPNKDCFLHDIAEQPE